MPDGVAAATCQVTGAAARKYLEGLAELPAFSAGVAKALGKGPREALLRVFQHDVAAAAAARPKLPIPGASPASLPCAQVVDASWHLWA